jgi:hypothetical protein
MNTQPFRYRNELIRIVVGLKRRHQDLPDFRGSNAAKGCSGWRRERQYFFEPAPRLRF